MSYNLKFERTKRKLKTTNSTISFVRQITQKPRMLARPSHAAAHRNLTSDKMQNAKKKNKTKQKSKKAKKQNHNKDNEVGEQKNQNANQNHQRPSVSCANTKTGRQIPFAHSHHHHHFHFLSISYIFFKSKILNFHHREKIEQINLLSTSNFFSFTPPFHLSLLLKNYFLVRLL